jgi:hypothetical protein
VKSNTKTIGEASQAHVLAALLSAGYVVSLPFGDNQRYDMIIETPGGFKTVQCKTGRLKLGSVVFWARTYNLGISQGYKGQVDLFGVFCPENGKTYIVPVADVGETAVALRVDPTANPNIRWARNYELKALCKSQ